MERKNTSTKQLKLQQAALGVVIALTATYAGADTLQWDATPGNSGAQDGVGGGIWQAGAANWFKSAPTPVAQDQVWANGNDAVFGANGNAGAINVVGTVTPTSLTFLNHNTTNFYNLTGSGTITTPNIVIRANPARISALLGSGFTLTGGGATSSNLIISGQSTYTDDTIIDSTAMLSIGSNSTGSTSGPLGVGGTVRVRGILNTSNVLDGSVKTLANPVSVESPTAQFWGAGGAIQLTGPVALNTYSFHSVSGSTITNSITTTAGTPFMKSGGTFLTVRPTAQYAFTDGVTVLQSNLVAEYTAKGTGGGGATGSDIFNTSNRLTLAEGVNILFQATGRGATASSQTFSGLTTKAGYLNLTANGSGANGKMVLNLNDITTNRSTGATLNFTLPTNVAAQDATNGFRTTSTNGAGTILGGWATVGKANWATVSSGNVIALSSYTADAWASGNDTDVTTSAAPAGGSTTNSLRFNGAASTLTLTGDNIVSSGGVLIGSGAGANTNAITGGSISSGSGQLSVQHFGTGILTLGSNVVDNSGATALTLNGSGPITVTGDNTHTGHTYIASTSTVRLDSATGYAVPGDVDLAGGTVRLERDNQIAPSGVVTFTGYSGTGNVLELNAKNLTLAGLQTTGTVRGDIVQLANVQNGTAGTSTLTLDTPLNTSYRYQGRISGNTTNVAGLVKKGAGKQTLIGTGSTYTGGTVVEAGTLEAAGIGGAQFFGVTTSTVQVGIGSGSANATLLADGVTVANPITVAANASANTLTIGGSNTTGVAVYTGAITLNKGVTLTSATGGTTEFRTGAWTTNNNAITVGSSGNLGTVRLLNAVSTSGGVNVAFGTLSTGAALTAPVTVAGGATLTGTGPISGTVDVNGTISPGNSPGTMSTGAETWAGGGSYLWEVNKVDSTLVDQPAPLKGVAPGFDFLNISGALNITATSGSPFVIDIAGLNLTNVAGAVDGFDNTKEYAWTIATASGGIAGFDPANFSLLTSSFVNNNALDPQGAFSLSTSGNDVVLNYTVPEPAAFGLFGLAGAFMLRRRTRVAGIHLNAHGKLIRMNNIA